VKIRNEIGNIGIPGAWPFASNSILPKWQAAIGLPFRKHAERSRKWRAGDTSSLAWYARDKRWRFCFI